MSASTPEPWAALRQALDQAVAAEVLPGWALCVRLGGAEIRVDQGGQAELRPRARPVVPELAWDLASLTKVLATTPLALSFVADGLLDLDRPLDALLPDAPPGVTARHCLQHSSGLPAWAPLYQAVVRGGLAWGSPATRAAVLEAARRVPPVAAPGTAHCYSDLGMLLLGAALEALGGDRLDRLWEQRVRRPSGLDLRWGWPGAAATEDCPVRGRVLVGEVHDLNAAVLGGIAPHAGLFGSARAVAAAGDWFLRAWRGEAVAGLSAALLREAWSQAGPGSHRLGWDSPSGPAPSASPAWPAEGVGHLGFTGTSLWIAPRQGLVVALCCNRVHPEVEGGSVPGGRIGEKTLAFRALRPRVHGAVIAALKAEGRWIPASGPV